MGLEGIPRNQSLARAMRLLRALASRPRGASATELASETAIPVATVTRTLATLSDEGVVVRAADKRRWVIGPELVNLVRAGDRFGYLRELAEPILGELAAAANETAYLGIERDSSAVEVIAQSSAPRLMRAASFVGRSDPLHATAFGKLLLAGLGDAEILRLLPARLPACTPNTITDRDVLVNEVRQVRRDGYATVRDELEIGLAGVAISHRMPGGELTFLGLAMPTGRDGPGLPAAQLEMLHSAASRLSAVIAAWSPIPTVSNKA
jgi:DNA-binding IclR family transcriptional regulator